MIFANQPGSFEKTHISTLDSFAAFSNDCTTIKHPSSLLCDTLTLKVAVQNVINASLPTQLCHCIAEQLRNETIGIKMCHVRGMQDYFLERKYNLLNV